MQLNPEEDYRGITMKPILGGRGWIAERGDWSQVRTSRQELKQDIDRILRTEPSETPFPGTEGLVAADNPRRLPRGLTQADIEEYDLRKKVDRPEFTMIHGRSYELLDTHNVRYNLFYEYSIHKSKMVTPEGTDTVYIARVRKVGGPIVGEEAMGTVLEARKWAIDFIESKENEGHHFSKALDNPKAMTPRSFIASARHALDVGDPESATVYAQAALDTAKESGDHIAVGIAKLVMRRIEKEGGRGPMSMVYDNPVPRAILYNGHRIVKHGLHCVVYPEDDNTPVGQADFPSLESAKLYVDSHGRVWDNPKLDRGGERAEYYHVRITDPKKFKDYRTVEFSRKQGILAIMGIDRRRKGPRGGVTHIQAFRFAKDMWSPSEIDSWLRKHGYGKLKRGI